MKTFKEYAATRDLAEAGFSADVVKVGNQLAAQNPQVTPGMTDLSVVKNALKQPSVSALAAKGKNPGAVGAYLAGPQAAKAAGIKTTVAAMNKK